MRYKNPLAKYKCPETDGLDKAALFHRDRIAGGTFENPYGVAAPLAHANIDEVEYIAGFWRYQDEFPHNIINVRGREMVLGRRHDLVEFGRFHYYDGYLVSYNCYGPFKIDAAKCIVGRVDTRSGSVWAYGSDIPAVRAFLSVALFDRHRDLVFSAAGANKTEKSH